MASATARNPRYATVSMKMPDLFASVTSMFAEAEKDFDTWKTCNRSLQNDIDELRKLVRSLTKSANELHYECSKPREIKMKSDPNVKLHEGNTMNKVDLWEKQKSTTKKISANGKCITSKQTISENRKSTQLDQKGSHGNKENGLCLQTNL